MQIGSVDVTRCLRYAFRQAPLRAHLCNYDRYDRANRADVENSIFLATSAHAVFTMERRRKVRPFRNRPLRLVERERDMHRIIVTSGYSLSVFNGTSRGPSMYILCARRIAFNTALLVYPVKMQERIRIKKI